MQHTSWAIVVASTRVGRDLTCRPGQVFDAYADLEQRLQWSEPGGETVVYGADDFRVGGTDHFVRGSAGSSLVGTIHYEQILDGERIVFIQRLRDVADDLLSISVVTWDIAETATGAHLDITDQATSVHGSGPIEGTRYGYDLMLDRLEKHLHSLR